METEKNRDKNPDRIIYVAMTLFNNFLFKRKHGHAASTRCVYDARLLFQHFINKTNFILAFTFIQFYLDIVTMKILLFMALLIFGKSVG